MPKLFAEYAFRTVYNSHKSFRVYVRLWHGGVCRMTSLSPHVYTKIQKRKQRQRLQQLNQMN